MCSVLYNLIDLVFQAWMSQVKAAEENKSWVANFVLITAANKAKAARFLLTTVWCVAVLSKVNEPFIVFTSYL